MRAARYAERSKPAAPVQPAPRRKSPAQRAEVVVPFPGAAVPAEPVEAPVAAADELCGHRSIGNKSCTREKDHQATGTKNHRYS
jgi:hypothetical protein